MVSSALTSTQESCSQMLALHLQYCNEKNQGHKTVLVIKIQYFLHLLKLMASSSVKKVRALPSLPALPVLPIILYTYNYFQFHLLAHFTYSVNVADSSGRKVVVEYQVHSLEINASPHDIRADQDPYLQGREGVN